MRLSSVALSAFLLAFWGGSFSCHDDDHHHRPGLRLDDVTVEITGDAGTDFDALFEDEDRSQSISGSVPFTADFLDQVEFFRAVVDKDSGGSERICVRVTATRDEREACTTAPFGRASVLVFF